MREAYQILTSLLPRFVSILRLIVAKLSSLSFKNSSICVKCLGGSNNKKHNEKTIRNFDLT